MYKNLADETKRIAKLLSSHLSPRLHSNLIDSANFHYSNSQAELTIQQHSEPPSILDSSSRPLVVKRDGKSYPNNPTNEYISRYPDGFFGCLGRGASSHQFKECKDNKVNAVRRLYWQELWARVPQTRKRVSFPFNPGVATNSMTFTAPPLSYHSGFEPQASGTTSIPVTGSLSPISVDLVSSTRYGLGRGSHINRPSWQTSDKRPQFFQYLVLF